MATKNKDKKTVSYGAQLKRPPHYKHVLTNPDEQLYIPIAIVERKLDEIFGWDGWETKNFHFTQGYKRATGIVELTVMSEKGRTITRVGARTLYMTDAKKDDDYIENMSGILLSLCLQNASKKLGVIFGRNLNRDIEDVPIKADEAVSGDKGVSSDIVTSAKNAISKATEKDTKIKHKRPVNDEIESHTINTASTTDNEQNNTTETPQNK